MPFAKQYHKKTIDINELAKMNGRSKKEIMDTIQEMEDKGLIKLVGENKYDFTPFLNLQKRFSEELRENGNADIKKLYKEVTGKQIQ
jgi:hypothetical protein